MITYGLLVVIAAWVAGATRPAIRVRRIVAPSLREHVSYVYGGAALLLLLVVLWGPLPSTREPFAILGLAILLSLGLYVLREMTVQEFPNAPLGESSAAVRTWLYARRDSARTAISSARSSSARTRTEPAESFHSDAPPGTVPVTGVVPVAGVVPRAEEPRTVGQAEASGNSERVGPGRTGESGVPSRAMPLAELERLADLRDRGALTEQEFEREKTRLLSNDS